jgi:hypothetical protein
MGELSPLPGGKLEHGGGAGVADEAARAHVAVDGERRAALVEEDEVEREAHAEGVDAGATGNQQADSGPLTPEQGEPQQPDAKAGRHRHLVAEDGTVA